jgi:hypothetical protein
VQADYRGRIERWSTDRAWKSRYYYLLSMLFLSPINRSIQMAKNDQNKKKLWKGLGFKTRILIWFWTRDSHALLSFDIVLLFPRFRARADDVNVSIHDVHGGSRQFDDMKYMT